MSDRATLRLIGEGIMERVPNLVRVSPGLGVPNLLVYNKPVELDDALAADATAFDGRESM